MRKSQFNKTANHQVIGNRHDQTATSIFTASRDNNDDFVQEQVEPIKTLLGNKHARGGRGKQRRGGTRGRHARGDLIEANKKRIAGNRQKIPKQVATKWDFLTFLQESKDRIAQEETEQEILTLITTTFNRLQ